jgi:hypothetical protein
MIQHLLNAFVNSSCLSSCSFPQTIYDLLVKSSGPLELREDPEQGVQVAGLRQISVHSAADILVRTYSHRHSRAGCKKATIHQLPASSRQGSWEQHKRRKES